MMRVSCIWSSTRAAAHLGTEVAEWYQREGYRALSGGSQRQIEELIAALKSAGRSEEIEGRIREIKTRRPAGAGRAGAGLCGGGAV